jgi:hypothetical protein
MATRAITLGEVNGGLPLDLDTPEGKKEYRNGMKPLEGDKYDLAPNGLRTFLEKFRAKARMYAWDGVLEVPDSTPAANVRDILNHYGSVTLLECQAHAEAYYIVRAKDAQDAQMMYNCLLDSITKEAQASLLVDKQKYHISSYMDGLCFLKVLLAKAQTDTIGTVNMLRTLISKLPSKMVELGGDIIAFNNIVKGIESSMSSYGEQSGELLINVILAYEQVEDLDFVNYVKNKRSLWEEGQTALDLHLFMTNCENKYKIRVQTGEWNAPTKQSEEFAAMKAELSSYKNQSNNGANNSNNNKTKEKLPYGERMKREKELNPWKWEAPKAGEPETLVKKGTTFHWCSKHAKWAGHSTSQCLGVGVNMRNNRNNNNNNNRNVAYEANSVDDQSRQSSLTGTTTSTATPVVQVNKAMMSISQGGFGLFD